MTEQIDPGTPGAPQAAVVPASTADVAPPPAWLPPPPGWAPPSADAWGYPGWAPWAAVEVERRPARHLVRNAAVAVMLVAVGAGGGTAITLATRSSTASPASATSAPAPAPAALGTAPSLSPLPTVPAQSGSGSGQTSGGSLDPVAIAAKVDPAIVDINVRIGSSGTAQGTGMILTSSGEVLTNNHVVEGATSLTVQIDGAGPQLAATVVGVDPTDDVALVQITGASNLPTVTLDNSSNVGVGDQIVALGNALGKGGTPAVTPGVVTALDQTITASDNGGANPETLTGMIQVQAGIEPGDSGGPVVDSAGGVIGMTTAGSSRTGRSATIGFVIPINKAMTVAHQIEAGSGPNVLGAHRGILGVSIDSAATATTGAAVAQVQAGSPAASAGIAGGDVITGLNGSSVGSAAALGTALRSHKPGDTVAVQWVDQAGTQHSAQLTLAEGPPA